QLARRSSAPARGRRHGTLAIPRRCRMRPLWPRRSRAQLQEPHGPESRIDASPSIREYHYEFSLSPSLEVFVSSFDLFKIGLGPSSSHTVGPMRAARRFVQELSADGKLDITTQVMVDLYGSLALTGRGHGTDRAILLGLSGETPDGIDPDQVEPKVRRIRAERTLLLDGRHGVPFVEQEHLRFRIDKALAFHSNGM